MKSLDAEVRTLSCFGNIIISNNNLLISPMCVELELAMWVQYQFI